MTRNKALTNNPEPRVTETTRRNRLLGAAALILGILLLTYSNHWHNSFHFDDSHTIENNVYIQHIEDIPLFFRDVTTFSSLPVNRSYRPVVTTLLAIDYWLGKNISGNGFELFWYHLSTFIFFLLQGVLMFFFFRKILESLQQPAGTARSKNPGNKPIPYPEGVVNWIALVSVAFYMLHPALAETINYIIAQSDSVSTFFLLLGFVLYQSVPRARRYHLYLLPVIVGCWAKPTALMFAPLLGVYYVLFEERASLLDLNALRRTALKPSILISFLALAAVYMFERAMEAGNFQPGGYSLFRYAITQPYVMLHYVGQFLLPTALSADTDWETFSTILEPRCIEGFVFLGVLLFAIVGFSRSVKWRPVSFGLAWFLIALIPTSVVPLAEVMNDHRVFFPYVGLSLALVWSLYLLVGSFLARLPKAVLATICIAIVGAYAYGTHERNAVWHTEETLWKDVTIKSPKNGRGMMNYGLVFMARGSYDTADSYFSRGLAAWPLYPRLHINMAINKNAMGDSATAERYFLSGIALRPDEADGYYYYGRYLSEHNRVDEAIARLEKCISLVDARIDARELLLPLLYRTGRLDKLNEMASRTLALVPGDPSATRYLELARSGKSPVDLAHDNPETAKNPTKLLDLSLFYYQAGDYSESINAAKSALKLKPDYAEAWNNICAAYNMLGNFEEGKRAGEEAVRLNPNSALAKANLAWSVGGLKKQ